jgi:hypothetical protein
LFREIHGTLECYEIQCRHCSIPDWNHHNSGEKPCNVAIAICVKTESLIICQCFLHLFIGIQHHAKIYEISFLALTSDPASSLHFFVRQDLPHKFKYKRSTRELLQGFNSPAFSFGSPKHLPKKPQQNRFQTEVLP